MKKTIAILTLVLTIGIIAVTLCFHPKPAGNESNVTVVQNQPQGILPGGCVVNPGNKPNMLVIGHSLGILYLIFGTTLALLSLKDKKNKHTDEEYSAKEEELNQAQAKLEEGNKILEELKASVEANKANLEKLETEYKTKLASKDDEIAKAKAETEAVVSRAENLEKDNKGVKREVDKLNSQLNASQKDIDDFKAQIIGLKKQLEEQSEELKAAAANVKGGKEAVPPAAYQILYLLQKEGRLIDLLNEDVSEVDDESLGGAVRPVLEGCAKLLKDRLIVEPVLNDEEGSEVTVEEADPETIKLSGNVPASGPYKGELIHHGWRLKECNLPELVDGWKGNVIAPAEIEI